MTAPTTGRRTAPREVPNEAWSGFADLVASQPGVVVAVVQGSDVDWRSFGATEPGGAPLELETPLYVASLAKQFTAACIASLLVDQQVSLDDRVSRWIPELERELAGVRLEHLISHTSGLSASNHLDSASGFHPHSRMTTADRLRQLRNVELEHEPGTVHRYSNHGFVLLGEVVARATGQPLGAFAADRLFEPLGMSDTAFLDIGQWPIAPGWAGGTRRIDVQFSCVGDGGLVSTVSDLAKWDRWLPTSPLAAIMLQPRPVLLDGTCAHNAWGVSIRSHHGCRIESHGGAIDGYLAKHVRFPELATSFIALANTDEFGGDGFDALIRGLADGTLGDALDLKAPDWTRTLTSPAS
jgi:CubicO group peptidase (beta-lactamase class C family)